MMAKILLGCYRKGEANDPAVYTRAVVSVLSDYPLDVVKCVVDPRNGLPSRQRFLPTITEVKEACEEENRRGQWAREWDARAIMQVQEAARLAGKPVPTALEVQKLLAKQGVHINVDDEQPLLEGPEGADRGR